MTDHPIAALFPLLSKPELQELADDIKLNGLSTPIIVLDDEILDGRNRYRACLIAGVEPVTKEFDGPDPLAFAISQNLRRRHLTDAQRALIAAEIATRKTGVTNPGVPTGTPQVSNNQASTMLNVTKRSVIRAKKVKSKAIPEIVEAVKSGKMELTTSARIADLPKVEQREALATPSAEPKVSKPTQIIPKTIPGDMISRSSAMTVLEVLRKQTAADCAYSHITWTAHHKAVLSLIQSL